MLLFKETELNDKEKEMCNISVRTPDGLWYCMAFVNDVMFFVIAVNISSDPELIEYLNLKF